MKEILLCYYTYLDVTAATELPMTGFRELVRGGFWIALPSGHQTAIGTHFIPPSQIKHCQIVELNDDDEVRLRTHGDMPYAIEASSPIQKKIVTGDIEALLRDGRKAYYMRDNLIFLNESIGIYDKDGSYVRNSFSHYTDRLYAASRFTHVVFTGDGS